MQSLYFLLWKTWKINKKDCLEGEHEEIDNQNGRINQQQVWSISYIKFQKDWIISTKNPPRTHQGLFWAFFWQKRTKQWFSRPELKIWRPGNTTNLISWLKICRNFQYIVDGPHRTLEEERLIVIVIIKAPFLATFILKIIAYDFSTYHSPTFKSCSGLGATISF